jgi:hypothetical protein
MFTLPVILALLIGYVLLAPKGAVGPSNPNAAPPANTPAASEPAAQNKNKPALVWEGGAVVNGILQDDTLPAVNAFYAKWQHIYEGVGGTPTADALAFFKVEHLKTHPTAWLFEAWCNIAKRAFGTPQDKTASYAMLNQVTGALVYQVGNAGVLEKLGFNGTVDNYGPKVELAKWWFLNRQSPPGTLPW